MKTTNLSFTFNAVVNIHIMKLISTLLQSTLVGSVLGFQILTSRGGDDLNSAYGYCIIKICCTTAIQLKQNFPFTALV